MTNDQSDDPSPYSTVHKTPAPSDTSDPDSVPIIPLVKQAAFLSSSRKEKKRWYFRVFRGRKDTQNALDDPLHGGNSSADTSDIRVEAHERILLSNIMQLRDMTADDVMVPRVDIIAVEATITKEELLKIYAETPRSRLPVYEETLDSIIGTVHMKDFMGQIARNEPFDLSKITREVPIISPSMAVLDLLAQMRETRNHMALVVDEYGGIDGLVTLGDVFESITGAIDDHYDETDDPMIKEDTKGHLVADARLPIDEFEEKIGFILLDEEERDEIETLGGLVFDLAGRIPLKGEKIDHPLGLSFEILDSDIRQIKKIRIRKKSSKKNLPSAIET